jgi:hypothetical protein
MNHPDRAADRGGHTEDMLWHLPAQAARPKVAPAGCVLQLGHPDRCHDGSLVPALPARRDHFFFPLLALRPRGACARSLAAARLAIFEDRGSLNVLPAARAAFLLVAIFNVLAEKCR